ncbi:phosphotransferase [Pseudomonas peli]|uniref:phosphotransferase n=1 Tax=Pseudomonas peli TaxID=592361 RepID=UPI0024ACBCD0|nr:phosphotransferase [Pseudomonas peli]
MGIEDAQPLIAKFYRPERWSDEAILEEHRFTSELAECEVPVVAPMQPDGRSLFEHAGFRFTLFPRRGGRAGAGQPRPALPPGPVARPPARRGRHPPVRAPCEALGVKNFGHAFADHPAGRQFHPQEPAARLRVRGPRPAQAGGRRLPRPPHQNIRLHGDCHPGNMMCRDETYHIVDLDDCRMGPAVQDLWMMLAGEPPGTPGATVRTDGRLQRVPRLRPAGTGPDRTPARPAPDALQRLAGAALGRPGVPA